MKKTILKPFIFLFRCIETIIFSVISFVVFIFVLPFLICKVKGKENIQKDDDAQIFLANHYEIFGPASFYINSPVNFRPWIIDKMMDRQQIEQHMGKMVYANYKHCPRFIKTIVLKIIKNYIYFIISLTNGISVSRDNLRKNILTVNESVKTLQKGTAIFITPEYSYKKEGVGEFQTGLTHVAKKYYDETGKLASYYPVFISKKKRTIYIGAPVKYRPNMNNEEKDEFINNIRNKMIEMYEDAEVKNQKHTKK